MWVTLSHGIINSLALLVLKKLLIGSMLLPIGSEYIRLGMHSILMLPISAMLPSLWSSVFGIVRRCVIKSGNVVFSSKNNGLNRKTAFPLSVIHGGGIASPMYLTVVVSFPNRRLKSFFIDRDLFKVIENEIKSIKRGDRVVQNSSRLRNLEKEWDRILLDDEKKWRQRSKSLWLKVGEGIRSTFILRPFSYGKIIKLWA